MTNQIGGLSNNELFCKIIKNNNFIERLSEELCWENDSCHGRVSGIN